MNIVFYSPVLNHHQANIADELWQLTGHSYRFVETLGGDTKGGGDFSARPYLLRAWQSAEEYKEAMELAVSADCCIFSGLQALPFQKARMRQGRLSFDMSERWLKRGLANAFSPTISRMWLAYLLGGWSRKPLYKLCCSGFAAGDQKRLGTFKGKCYKWGYFTRSLSPETEIDITPQNPIRIMWCSRYLILKHPELPMLMAQRLKAKGYRFVIDMYGAGEYEAQAKALARDLGVEDVMRFMGTKPNDELMADMRQHSIFLFTSDSNEGWGAVVNESMTNGCAIVSSDVIGSTPYLVKDGETGFSFRSASRSSSFGNPDLKALDSLCKKMEHLLSHPDELQRMRQNARQLMQDLWSPKVAAERLLTLIDCLKQGKASPFSEGPCSLA